MMTIYNILPLVSSISFLSIGLMVYFNGRGSKTNFRFLVFCFFTFWWQFSWFFLFSVSDPLLGALLIKIGYSGIAFIPASFFHFFYLFLRLDGKFDRFLYRISYVFSFSLVFLLFFSEKFIDGYYSYYWGFYPSAGPVHPIFLSVLFLLMLRISYLLIMRYKERKSGRFNSNQTKYVLIGFFFYCLSSIDFAVNYGYGTYPFGSVFLLLFLLIIAYAIVVHSLMDIRLTMRRYFVYILSVVSVAGPIYSLKYLIEQYYGFLPNAYFVLLIVFTIYIFPVFRDIYYRLANRYFFASLYDLREAIEKISSRLGTTLESEEIVDFVSSSLETILRPSHIRIMLYNPDILGYEEFFDIGRRKASRSYVFSNNFEKRFIFNPDYQINEPFIVDELRSDESVIGFDDDLKIFQREEIEAVAPLNVKNKAIGMITIGKKQSGDAYNADDLKLLKIISSQLSVSLDNALLYKESIDFNAKLAFEVEKATHDLKRANDRLKKLDQAKSEFISIASHQLRTPLTVIKGYISMMLDGDFGQLSGPERDSLDKVYRSNERLINLVENLLNVSRIESGKFLFNFQKKDIAEVVSSVYEELSKMAQAKSLAFCYDRPQAALPEVLMDEEKLRQVIMNLTDNAIKYTKEGSVSLSLGMIAAKKSFLEKDSVRFCISDSGMGISSADLPNLFKKFSRGNGISLVHTEGTGLGLFVAKKIISAHEGRIWAESLGEGRGSKFCFELPVAK